MDVYPTRQQATHHYLPTYFIIPTGSHSASNSEPSPIIPLLVSHYSSHSTLPHTFRLATCARQDARKDTNWWNVWWSSKMYVSCLENGKPRNIIQELITLRPVKWYPLRIHPRRLILYRFRALNLFGFCIMEIRHCLYFSWWRK